MHNPINCEFSDGGAPKGDCISCSTKNSQTFVTNLECTKAAYSKSNELGSLYLFFTDNLRQIMIEWTNAHCGRSGTQSTRKDDLDVFVGLEVATSLKGNNIKRQLMKQTFHRRHDLQQMLISRQTLRHPIQHASSPSRTNGELSSLGNIFFTHNYAFGQTNAKTTT